MVKEGLALNGNVYTPSCFAVSFSSCVTKSYQQMLIAQEFYIRRVLIKEDEVERNNSLALH